MLQAQVQQRRLGRCPPGRRTIRLLRQPKQILLRRRIHRQPRTRRRGPPRHQGPATETRPRHPGTLGRRPQRRCRWVWRPEEPGWHAGWRRLWHESGLYDAVWGYGRSDHVRRRYHTLWCNAVRAKRMAVMLFEGRRVGKDGCITGIMMALADG